MYIERFRLVSLDNMLLCVVHKTGKLKKYDQKVVIDVINYIFLRRFWIGKNLVGPLGVNIAGYGQMVLVDSPIYFQDHSQ